MRGIDILGLVAIAVFFLGIGWLLGDYNTVSKSTHTEQITNYKAAIDSYRDYVVALEKSTDIPSNPALELLRTNIENNVICDLPGKHEEYQVMNTYRSYR